jgi:starch synthase (maltosyl-transferring)
LTRHGRAEPEEYCRELAGPAAAYMNPSCWSTTHGILTPFVQHGGPTAWRMRAALAATLVPAHGIYAGYELVEHLPRPGVEEQIDDEKYQYKDRGWQAHEPGAPEGGSPSRLT